MNPGAVSAVDVEDLDFHYGGGGFRLDVARFRVERGEKVACIGPSGSGKSTFLSLLAGILAPLRGRIRVAGEELTGRADGWRRRFRISRVGLVFQEFELLDHLTVRENVLLPFYVNPVLALDREVEERLALLVERAGLTPFLARRPRALSHGERQRVAICRALITEPGLLLADEPTGNLDPEATARVLEMLVEEVSRRDATLILVTHDHGLLDAFDRVVDFREFQGALR